MTQEKLTPAMCRYLRALRELDPASRGVRSVDIARKLNVSRASVHAMLRRLCDLGYAAKEHYGIVYLSEKGVSASENCQ